MRVTVGRKAERTAVGCRVGSEAGGGAAAAVMQHLAQSWQVPDAWRDLCEPE